MSSRPNPYTMPDVPDMDFVGALAEMWFVVSYAAYHLAYVRAYLQIVSLQTDVDVMRKQEQALRDSAQVDTVICRAHLAAFFWQIDHFFEALRAAVKRGQKEHPDLKYFWAYEKRLAEIEDNAIRKEIKAYRTWRIQSLQSSDVNGKKREENFSTTFCLRLRGWRKTNPLI